MMIFLITVGYQLEGHGLKSNLWRFEYAKNERKTGISE